MAMLKSITHQRLNLGFHRGLHFDYQNQGEDVVAVEIGSWLDSDDFDDGNPPKRITNRRIPAPSVADLNAEEMNLLRWVYVYLASEDGGEFQDATSDEA